MQAPPARGLLREICRDELLEQFTRRLTSSGMSDELARRQSSRFLDLDRLLRKILTGVLDARASASEDSALGER